MEKNEIRALSRLLARVESSEGKRFAKAVRENAIEYLEVFDQGVFVIYPKEDGEYDGLCAFRGVMRDYGVALRIERAVNQFLQKLGPDELFCFAHGGDQLFLNQFVCKLNFEKPHYGLEYSLKRRDFDVGGACDLRGLTASAYAYDQADAMFAIHCRAFGEQNARAGHADGYDEEDVAYLMKRFSRPDDGKTLTVFTLHEKMVGYTVFEGDHCETLALDPCEQGKGYGKAMLTYAVGQAFRDEKLSSIRLHTFFINAKAQRLYERVGFKRTGFFCLNDSKKREELRFPSALSGARDVKGLEGGNHEKSGHL